ncbi:MAG: hypothetical protein CM15mP25_0510 [Gammaproteobacteria bacterium]|nr:MAG: hypothetical protein CM15mP25_0510 [Gammaproteobacteria bacterium]
MDALFDEYVRVQSQHLDMPSVLTQLSGFQQARGDAKRPRHCWWQRLRKILRRAPVG